MNNNEQQKNNVNNQNTNNVNSNSMNMVEIKESETTNDKKNTEKKQIDLDKTINVVYDKLVNTKDVSTDFTLAEINPNKKYAILCYIPFLCFLCIGKNIHKTSRYIFFHVNQGINLTIVWVFALGVDRILNYIFLDRSVLNSSVPTWVSFISFALYALMFVINVIGLSNTFKGKSKELIFIGDLRFIK